MNTKLIRRGRLILANSASNGITLIFNPLLSLSVVRLASPELWGEFVSLLLAVQLAAHFVGWGNKEYLLRQFSRNPAGIGAAWRRSLSARVLLLLPTLVVVGLLFPGWAPLLGLWIAVLVLSQSHDVLVIYRREFLLAGLLELTALIMTTGFVLWQRSALTLARFVPIFIAATAVKGVVLLLRYARQTGVGSGRWQRAVDWRFFTAAFPFFMVGLSGLLQSRIDLYVVNYLVPAGEVARYQVWANFLLYLPTLAGFILVPFVRSLYRLELAAIKRLTWRLLLAGLLMTPPAVLLMSWVVRGWYGFDLPLSFLLAGGLSVLPVFFYSPLIYTLFKQERQNIVVVLGLSAALANLILDLIIVPLYGSGGALAVTAAVESVVAVAYGVLVWRTGGVHNGRMDPLHRQLEEG